MEGDVKINGDVDGAEGGGEILDSLEGRRLSARRESKVMRENFDNFSAAALAAASTNAVGQDSDQNGSGGSSTGARVRRRSMPLSGSSKEQRRKR